MGVKIRVNTKALKRDVDALGRVSRRLQDLTQVWNEVAVIMGSQRENVFSLQGSPKRWKKSERAKKEKGQTLIKERDLLNSLTVASHSGAYRQEWPLMFEMGSTLEYAAIHNYGGTITVKRKLKDGSVVSWDIKMPKREYLNLRRRDRAEIIGIIRDHMTRVIREEMLK